MYECDACGARIHPADSKHCTGCEMVGVCFNCHDSGKLCRSECGDRKPQARKLWGFGELKHALWEGDRLVFDSCRDMGLTAQDAKKIEDALNAHDADAEERADQAEAKLMLLRKLVLKWDPRLAEVIGLEA